MLTLIVPGLMWTRQALADLTYDLPLPAFTALLGRGRLQHRPPSSSESALATAFGLAAPLPAAALRRHALQPESAVADPDVWLCLDPVHLRFEQHHLVVEDPRRLDLTDEEAAALAVSLAPTFAGLGQLDVIAPHAWNLRLTDAAPEFPPLPESIGRAAAPLPLTPTHAAWRLAISEAQMLLHAHPVNQAREAAGKAVVNSVWPWGGGCLSGCDARLGAHDALWSNDPVARGIARMMRFEDAGLPPGFTVTRRRPLVILDALDVPARSGDALRWRDELAALETDWLAPALAALRAGKLDALRLLAPGEGASGELDVQRHDLWKFWRKPRPLAELAPP